MIVAGERRVQVDEAVAIDAQAAIKRTRDRDLIADERYGVVLRQAPRPACPGVVVVVDPIEIETAPACPPWLTPP
ncbi:hypothetical protein FYA86_12590 [Bordetella holmesii]|nr:hypothetical protein FYA86_12590 [Bordetella holmesii]